MPYRLNVAFTAATISLLVIPNLLLSACPKTSSCFAVILSLNRVLKPEAIYGQVLRTDAGSHGHPRGDRRRQDALTVAGRLPIE